MPYQIPRNVKGEGRILYIFSTKALIYTAVGAGIRTNFCDTFRYAWTRNIKIYSYNIISFNWI